METSATPPPLPAPPPVPPPAVSAAYPGFWQAIAMILLLFILQLAAISVAMVAHAALTGGSLDKAGAVTDAPFVLGIVNLASFTAVSLLIGRLSGHGLGRLLATAPPPGTFEFRNVLAIVTAVTGQLFFSIGLIYAVGGKDIDKSDYVQRLERVVGSGQDWRIVIPLLVIIAPLTEEILFRGQLLRGFLRRYPAGVAIALSAAMFSVMHMNPVQAPATFLLGILAGWLYYRTRSVWPAIAAHFINNSFPALALATGAAAQAKTRPAPDPSLTAAIGMAAGGVLVWMAAFAALRNWMPAAEPEPDHFDKLEEMSSSVSAASASREQLRSQAGVQLVKAENEGFALAKQPAGTYGFSFSPLIECPVFLKQTFQVFEVHKRADNSQWLIGYVSSEHEALINGDQEPIDVTLYPEPHEKATQLVAIRLERIIKKKQPTRIDGNYIQMTLARL